MWCQLWCCCALSVDWCVCRARESLRQCLQWVSAQGSTVDAVQLVQLLKQQIEVHSVESQASPCEEAPSLTRLDGLSEDSLPSPERSTAAGGNAMEETPDAGSRKRKGDDLLEDERLLQALPAAWPRTGVKSARRCIMSEPKLGVGVLFDVPGRPDEGNVLF